MKKILGVTLGIMTALGGFVDLGQIVFTTQAGALFGYQLMWAIALGTAAIIGISAGVVCYYAVALKNWLELDDALDVWGVHGVGGLLGTILLGVFRRHGTRTAPTGCCSAAANSS